MSLIASKRDLLTIPFMEDVDAFCIKLLPTTICAYKNKGEMDPGSETGGDARVLLL
jgi:hypothetical protein